MLAGMNDGLKFPRHVRTTRPEGPARLQTVEAAIDDLVLPLRETTDWSPSWQAVQRQLYKALETHDSNDLTEARAMLVDALREARWLHGADG
jgi:hypothetical protein